MDFFAGLIDIRCTGEYARWGCMLSNAHAGTENDDPQVRAVLDRRHGRLREALRSAHRQGRLGPGADLETAADVLALLTHGVNLRSRAGADARELRRTVTAAIETLTGTARRLTRGAIHRPGRLRERAVLPRVGRARRTPSGQQVGRLVLDVVGRALRLRDDVPEFPHQVLVDGGVARHTACHVRTPLTVRPG